MTTLLLHPIGLDRHTWDGVAIDNALAVDLPGHGGAPGAELPSLDDVADAVLEAVPLELGPLDVVGLSLGGMVALHAVLRHPQRIRSLVVACAPALSPADAMLQRAADTERLGMRGMMPSTLQRWFSADVLEHTPDFVDTAARMLLANDPRVVAHFWRLISQHDVRTRLSEIRVFTTIVAGRADLSVPRPAAQALARGIPGARYVELPGAHMLHLEAPGAFAETIREHTFVAQYS
ncbi:MULTISPECIES: alpha/beta fold hydrolase [unclassified Microbacterium]|uniref:alpha/beta fold hydrolase n=1 Tax=unclassified Microbacterium TaxID=2609290 RepID=UPI0012FD8903|nr:MULTISPECIES: alpha/beta fold hydrolase [unclassified Microbacterium]